MRVFNRIIMISVFAALFLGGVFGTLYSFELLGYRQADLFETLGLSAAYSGIEGFVNSIESGEPSAAVVAALVAVALVGLALLFLELKPRTPRRVRMGKGTYLTRKAVEERVEAAALEEGAVLEANASVKARRGRGAKVRLDAKSRRGEDTGAVAGSVKERLRSKLGDEAGIPVGRPKVKVEEVDPRKAKARVK